MHSPVAVSVGGGCMCGPQSDHQMLILGLRAELVETIFSVFQILENYLHSGFKRYIEVMFLISTPYPYEPKKHKHTYPYEHKHAKPYPYKHLQDLRSHLRRLVVDENITYH